MPGLARYEPYVGVRLTPAGEKLAALVLRRHRLIELFLVKVMGMSWTDVHEEAEQLEHAASDRLIARMDEMLGRPEVDPHGDPIPGPEGFVPALEYDDLLTCPLGEPVTVSRLSDQDRELPRVRGAARSQARRRGPSRRARSGRRQRAVADREGPALHDWRARSVKGTRPRREDCGAAPVPHQPRFRRRRPRPSQPNRSRSRSSTTPFSSRKRSTRRGSRPEHLRRDALAGHLGEHVHAGVAGAVTDAPAFLHHCVFQWRPGVGIWRHPHQLSIPGCGRRAGRVGFFTARQPCPSHRKPWQGSW